MNQHSDEQALAEFLAVRPRLFGIAYRMLGSTAEADDIAQDVWLRWQATDRDAVLDPPAFLATTATRLAINVLQSARTRRETYIGPWLPEPLDTSANPLRGVIGAEALELAVLLLLEKLPPKERAAYVLREAFEYPYEQIAEILQLSEANARQLVSRARKHVTDGRPAPVSPAERQRLLSAFIAAAQQGDFASLEALFAPDVVSYSDGGGVVRAARIPVVGRERVAKVVTAFAPRFWPGAVVEWMETNGETSVRVSRDGVAAALVSIDAGAEGINRILWVMNPAKLVDVAGLPGRSLA